MNKVYCLLIFVLSQYCWPAYANKTTYPEGLLTHAGNTKTQSPPTPGSRLLPLPQSVKWKPGGFSLKKCRLIVYQHDSLRDISNGLQKTLEKMGWKMVVGKQQQQGRAITLKLGKVNAPDITNEAYSLEINANEITITARSAHGIFNGIQTLLQLEDNPGIISACTITDWPAFSWRGYMVDVGRNFMSMNMLKQQIDVMAAYKLNVFHFHPTEDIAWRIESRLYPQLHAADNMLRNKGSYYSTTDIQELINYCRERFIQFVPEIDMPGHSAAFKRAMHTDMQSDSGLPIVKNIIREFCATYDLPYFHIGADEVKITNKEFVPQITALLETLGKKVIGWQPGGNFSPNTIRQLWMENGSTMKSAFPFPVIDSRHLYINHFDPLESVVTIFNRRIGNVFRGDSIVRGGTLCLWNDRAVAKEDDLLHMNPVYPSMLTFAERSWRGGGKREWVANVNDGDKEAFAAFEDRLLKNKQSYFAHLPFPWVRQSSVQWDLYGPYENNGNLSAKFAPETAADINKMAPYSAETGGTIILRHFWHPLVKGAIDNPSENTTFYAARRIYSQTDGYKNFWIGFNNLSRSYASNSPPRGQWDDRGSAVLVNGKLISLPDWQRAGEKGDMEIPLIDEGYEYRPPTNVFLKKGWNQVLIKLPVAKFKSADWQSPVKWMFTFVEEGK